MKRKTVYCLIGIALFFYTLSSFADPISIHVEGISGDMLENVQKRLSILAEDTNQERPAFQKAAQENIIKAMEPFGYFQPQIHAQYKIIKNTWQANFSITQGPALKVTTLQISVLGEGKQNPALTQYLHQFPLKTQQVFNASDYNNAKQKLFEIALQQGYLKAWFVTQEIDISLKNHTCDIRLTLNTGPRYYFGKVTFSKTPLSDKFLQRFVPFKTGTPFSSNALLTLQDHLNSTSYFKRVNITNDIDQASNYFVPIETDLVMQKMQQWLFGIGYGTDTGPRLTLGSQWRYLNSSGHQFNTQALISPVQSSLIANYIIPGTNPVTDEYNITGGLITNHLNQGDSTTEQIGVSAIKVLTPLWQQTLSLNYQIEQFQFDGEANQNSKLLIPGVSWLYNSSNDKIFPTQGNRFLLSLQGSLENPISDTSFFQAEVQDKYITHFTDNDRFIARIDLGYTAVHDLDSFPLSLRFYAGGAQSVRGFSYQSLGPGRYLAVGSAEFQQRIIGKWYGAVFYDEGNAMDEFDTPLERGAGLGVVWASPVGTMELTLAKALSLPGMPYRVQFTLGSDL